MRETLPIIVLGFVLGMRHATDPDHVIAVATIVSRQATIWRGALIGILWGIGHSVTITLVGGAIIVFGVVISPRVGLAMEFCVALMLILLGALTLTGTLQRVAERFDPRRRSAPGVHTHSHLHGDYLHAHAHGHELESHGHTDETTPLARFDRTFGGLGPYQVIRPLVVGLVHGLAGSAAVALLVLATIRDPVWALGYLLLFGVGTIAGMMLITAAIGLPFAVTARQSITIHRALGTASGLLSLGLGLFLAYQIGLVDGLFTSHPTWKPE